MAKRIEILDTTLRDGLQAEGISYSVLDKLNIVKSLDDIGISIIEAGNVSASDSDMQLFEEISKINLKNSKVAAFGNTCRKNTAPKDDYGVKNLINVKAEIITLVGKSWDMHVEDVLKTSKAENLAMIENTIRYLTSADKRVIFDAEHFFDGYKNNKEYAIETLKFAVRAGASSLTLCDTNGGCFPEEIANITKTVSGIFDIPVGIHAHNDCGMAVANAVAAVQNGALHVQGTMIGIGERCGNTALCTLIPNLQLKKGYLLISPDKMKDITHVARKIADISNISLPKNMPYVGGSAFYHKAGMHADGVNKVTCSFEHVNPETVGNERKFPVSEMAGRTSVLMRAKKIAPNLHKDSPEMTEILEKMKNMERGGYQFEAAEGSFELLVKKTLGIYKPSFELLTFKSISEQPSATDKSASVFIKIRVGDKTEITAAEGDGPIHALDKALRKALEVFYPELKNTKLTDFKVRVLTPESATAAKVRVLITSASKEKSWTTVGVSADILEASWIALVDSMEYILQDK